MGERAQNLSIFFKEKKRAEKLFERTENHGSQPTSEKDKNPIFIGIFPLSIAIKRGAWAKEKSKKKKKNTLELHEKAKGRVCGGTKRKRVGGGREG